VKEFIGTCVENPFDRIEELTRIVENGEELDELEFRRHCLIHPDILRDMEQYPNDYAFYKFRDIYYYVWSAIEHFYQ